MDAVKFAVANYECFPRVELLSGIIAENVADLVCIISENKKISFSDAFEVFKEVRKDVIPMGEEKASVFLKSLLNSIECNNDQTDRGVE